jgi:hypothetical protein
MGARGEASESVLLGRYFYWLGLSAQSDKIEMMVFHAYLIGFFESSKLSSFSVKEKAFSALSMDIEEYVFMRERFFTAQWTVSMLYCRIGKTSTLFQVCKMEKMTKQSFVSTILKRINGYSYIVFQAPERPRAFRGL